ncbi:MAG TPA: DUF2155 domain-containing protein [Alphaproteobacteria bacterium]|nr:DUF2155 domain-containing protein [Alphaproteobacteria bacterium]
MRVAAFISAGLRAVTLAVAVCGAISGARATDLVGDGVLLQGLDKVTARISEVRVPLGAPVQFGTLSITAYKCFKRPPEETPESVALLEIRDARPGEPGEVLFRGWMFASSPALNALEHPVYDVWVKDCLNAKSPESSGPE